MALKFIEDLKKKKENIHIPEAEVTFWLNHS